MDREQFIKYLTEHSTKKTEATTNSSGLSGIEQSRIIQLPKLSKSIVFFSDSININNYNVIKWDMRRLL